MRLVPHRRRQAGRAGSDQKDRVHPEGHPSRRRGHSADPREQKGRLLEAAAARCVVVRPEPRQGSGAEQSWRRGAFRS